MWQGPIDSGQEDTVENVTLRSAAVVVFVMLVLVPTRAGATIDSVTVKATWDYANAAGYPYAEITIHGSVARADGSVGCTRCRPSSSIPATATLAHDYTRGCDVSGIGIVTLTVTDSAGQSDTNVIRMGFVDMTPD